MDPETFRVDLTRRLARVCSFQMLPRGVDIFEAERLGRLWRELVETGPGVELVDRIASAYEEVTADAVRRERLWGRLSAVVDKADAARLSSIEILLDMFEAVPGEPELLTAPEWESRTGVEIRVPSGWRGSRGVLEPISRDEFLARAANSTARWPDVLLDEIVEAEIVDDLDEASGEPIIRDP